MWRSSPPSATWERAMSWWQGTRLTCNFYFSTDTAIHKPVNYYSRYFVRQLRVRKYSEKGNWRFLRALHGTYTIPTFHAVSKFKKYMKLTWVSFNLQVLFTVSSIWSKITLARQGPAITISSKFVPYLRSETCGHTDELRYPIRTHFVHFAGKYTQYRLRNWSACSLPLFC
jgi:hypothetical protein